MGGEKGGYEEKGAISGRAGEKALPNSIFLKQPQNPATLDFDVQDCTVIMVNFLDEPTCAENKT